MYQFQISSSSDCTASPSKLPSRSDHRHWLRPSVAMAMQDDRHRSVGLMPYSEIIALLSYYVSKEVLISKTKAYH
ncbi:hypothetical protein CMV_029529 [Castanea mollissima]|uniref:Uncharacterized protein n=1 Tax=Castanea mollissima TaxID=60419 RepID=A0A8J4V410_9ROSI|nr:hypothetical protein CMV_029529 [Castanea mollissima]